MTGTPAKGLVLDELPKLMKRPVAQATVRRPPRPLLTASRPLPNAREIFEDNRGVSCLCLAYDTVADRVVGVALKPGLLTG
jgi:hypothetical protein